MPSLLLLTGLSSRAVGCVELDPFLRSSAVSSGQNPRVFCMIGAGWRAGPLPRCRELSPVWGEAVGTGTMLCHVRAVGESEDTSVLLGSVAGVGVALDGGSWVPKRVGADERKVPAGSWLVITQPQGAPPLAEGSETPPSVLGLFSPRRALADGSCVLMLLVPCLPRDS